MAHLRSVMWVLIIPECGALTDSGMIGRCIRLSYGNAHNQPTPNWLVLKVERPIVVANRLSLGVLGLHAIKEKPVAVNGRVEIRPVCFL